MNGTISGICLLLLLGSQALYAQEAEQGAADDQSVFEEEADAVENSTSAEPTAEIDDIEPGVTSEMLAADVNRVRVSSGVMDELDLGATEITGNQELPRVLYIVPWRESDPGDLMGRPANTLLDDVLAPVDRREFTREVDYYGDLFGNDEEP